MITREGDAGVDIGAPQARRCLDKQTFVQVATFPVTPRPYVPPRDALAPMHSDVVMEFAYKHSTGETVGRFLAGLKEQRVIWGQRVAGQGVVVPPLGYSEVDGSTGAEWVAVQPTGTVTAVARVHRPIDRLHPTTRPFAFILVRLDGADTALAHIVTDDLDRLRVGARVEATWRPDGEREGTIRDIAGFRVVG
jgi:hypothetical protein